MLVYFYICELLLLLLLLFHLSISSFSFNLSKDGFVFWWSLCGKIGNTQDGREDIWVCKYVANELFTTFKSIAWTRSLLWKSNTLCETSQQTTPKLLQKLQSKLLGFKYSLLAYHSFLNQGINNPSKNGKHNCAHYIGSNFLML